MQSRSLARELALLVLGQIPDRELADIPADQSLEGLLQKSLDILMQHWREGLDTAAAELEKAQQLLLDSELQQGQGSRKTMPSISVCGCMRTCLVSTEQVLNSLSATIELTSLLAVADQERVRCDALNRVCLVIERKRDIDDRLDSAMEAWRLRRLPRIDRDILRLAVVDLSALNTPVAVSCNEAVELAHRYSDDQGRRMINGVLRRLQDATLTPLS